MGSNPPIGSECRFGGGGVQAAPADGGRQHKGSYQSGQMGQTVNLLAYAFGGSNPSLPTEKKESAGRSCKNPDDGRERGRREGQG